MSRFFVNRPIFAWVIAIVMMLGGLLAIYTLPVSMYPTIAPPLVRVSATYPGASAETIQNTIVQQIEQAMTGLDGYMYMSSNSDSTGRATVEITFRAGTNPDIAQVQVQNRLKKVENNLPDIVQQLGVSVDKSAANFLMVVGFVDKHGRLTESDLGDYLVNTVQDPLSRINGVGRVEVFGSSYAMRIWLDPEKLNKYKISAQEIVNAVSEQNVQLSAGQIGNFPTDTPFELNAAVKSSSFMQTVGEFENIMLRTETDGSRVLLKDVARVSLGQQSYMVMARDSGLPTAGIAIEMSSGANAIQTSANVHEELDRLSKYFPDGVEWIVPFDTTPFVTLSIHEVVKTLVEAIMLVVVVMFLFLQNWRATLIPTIAVPVVLLGTFGILALLGYSINVLTMFAMVLAIGLLVDDAIVVVENVERVMTSEGLSPKEATIRSMGQITGALVGIALVLAAVFVPMAFFGGSTGIIYRQFSVTIVSAMALSVMIALILTPALCATILKPVDPEVSRRRSGFFGTFNRCFEKFSYWLRAKVGEMIYRVGRTMLVYIVIAGLCVFGFSKLPTSFLPGEDQGSLIVQLQLPPNASQQRTQEVIARITDYFKQNEEDNIESVFALSGFSFGGTGQSTGMAFVKLKDWSERTGKGQDVFSITNRAMREFSTWTDARVYAFPPPAMPDLGLADGFDMYLQADGTQTHEEIMQARNLFLKLGNEHPALTAVRPNGMDDVPEVKLDIDREKARALGVSMAGISSTLNYVWASTYINDFLERGRVKKVYIQGDPQYLQQPEDLLRWYVKNDSGEMVPFSSFATVGWSYGAQRLERFNGIPSVNIQGAAAPGYSSGDAMNAVEEIAAQLPGDYSVAWNGISYQEKESGGRAAPLYALSILIVFLCLAALYESWALPTAVILVIPMGVLGALYLTWAVGLANDIYFQVGLITTIGLVSKNAILIVEFAKTLHESGENLVRAALDALRLRLRPILMTSLAFGFGVLPLAIATGASSGAQNAIGTGVLGGVITGTFLCVIFVPVFYVAISYLFSRDRKESISKMARDILEQEHGDKTIFINKEKPSEVK